MQLNASHLTRGAAAPRRCCGRVAPFAAPVQVQQARCQQVQVRAGKLGDVSLFGESTSSLLSGSAAKAEVDTSKKIDAVTLESEVSMDYTQLRDFLKDGKWREAEDETRALLIKLAGEGAVKRNWVYFSEVKDISVKDFRTIDNLWKAASNGKFGFSVQKEIYVQCQKRWPKFFKQIDWTTGENNVYRKWPAEFNYSLDAVRGHLPLTNALRGTQLFQAILDHPAFDQQKKAGSSLDERAAAKSKLQF